MAVLGEGEVSDRSPSGRPMGSGHGGEGGVGWGGVLGPASGVRLEQDPKGLSMRLARLGVLRYLGQPGRVLVPLEGPRVGPRGPAPVRHPEAARLGL